MEEGISKQMMGIIERADEFMVSMKNDLEKMVAGIEIIVENTKENGMSWTSITTTKSLTSGNSNMIDEK